MRIKIKRDSVRVLWGLYAFAVAYGIAVTLIQGHEFWIVVVGIVLAGLAAVGFGAGLSVYERVLKDELFMAVMAMAVLEGVRMIRKERGLGDID